MKSYVHSSQHSFGSALAINHYLEVPVQLLHEYCSVHAGVEPPIWLHKIGNTNAARLRTRVVFFSVTMYAISQHRSTQLSPECSPPFTARNTQFRICTGDQTLPGSSRPIAARVNPRWFRATHMVTQDRQYQRCQTKNSRRFLSCNFIIRIRTTLHLYQDDYHYTGHLAFLSASPRGTPRIRSRGFRRGMQGNIGPGTKEVNEVIFD